MIINRHQLRPTPQPPSIQSSTTHAGYTARASRRSPCQQPDSVASTKIAMSLTFSASLGMFVPDTMSALGEYE